MSYFSYEYFSGANTVVEVNGVEALEAAGISFGISESRRPIYGYSSRHYDVVARGQVLVQGSMLINYVHQDYLYEVLRYDESNAEEVLVARRTQLEDVLNQTSARDELVREIGSNYVESLDIARSFQDKYWSVAPDAAFPNRLLRPTYNPHDFSGPVTLKITFGPRQATNQFRGFTGVVLSGVYFLGRARAIQATEEVLVEEYQFIARNMHSLNSVSMQWSEEVVPPENSIRQVALDGLRDLPNAPAVRTILSDVPQLSDLLDSAWQEPIPYSRANRR
jgi:hypothetical protein